MHLNPPSNDKLSSSDGSEIESIDYFKYSGSYTDTEHDLEGNRDESLRGLHRFNAAAWL